MEELPGLIEQFNAMAQYQQAVDALTTNWPATTAERAEVLRQSVLLALQGLKYLYKEMG